MTQALMAQYSIDSLDTLYEESFDYYRGTGLVAGGDSVLAGSLDSNSWAFVGLVGNGLGESSYSDVSTDFGEDYLDPGFARGVASNGIDETGIYAVDLGGDDYALGVQLEGDAGELFYGAAVMALQNNTGSVIDSVDLSFDVLGLNDTDGVTWAAVGISDTYQRDLSTANLAGLGSIWVTSSALDDPAAWVDMPASSAPSNDFTLDNLDIADGETSYFYLASVINSGSGLGDEVAWDNLSILAHGATAVPEPSTYALIFGGLAAMGFIYRRRKQR